MSKETSRDQVQRLLILLPWLQRQGTVTVDDAVNFVKRHGWTIRANQLIDDLQIAVFCGPSFETEDLIDIDMDMVREEKTITVRNAELLSQPMRFSTDEAVSLQAALGIVAELAAPDMADAARRASHKLAQTLGDQPVLVDATPAAGERRVRDQIYRAIADRTRVRLTYDGEQRGETTTPLVDPVTLTTEDMVTYLQAYNIERDAWRTYRLDRIAEIEPAGTSSDHGAAPQFDVLADRRLTASFACRPEAAWLLDIFVGATRETLPDGRIVVTVDVNEPNWLVRFALRAGGAFENLQPAHLAEKAAWQAREALERYEAIRGSLDADSSAEAI